MNGELTHAALKKIADGRENMGYDESLRVFDEIVEGEVDASILAAFLTALKMKGETIDEIVGAASAMRRKATFINAGTQSPIDIVGTGGDELGTFNISTTSTFIVAGAGVSIAKHGNRAATSKSGSADVLAALGFNLDVRPAVMEHCLQENGIAFLFAAKMHPAMRFAAPVRKALGFRTVFNMLGPLLNPAGATKQVVGVFGMYYTEVMAECLRKLGSRRAFVVHGNEGLDEISATSPTRISELRNGSIKTYEFNPRKYLPRLGNFSEIVGGTPQENAEITLEILSGKRRGAARDICVLNSAAGILVDDRAQSFEEAMKMAEVSIDSGAAMHKLQTLIEFSKQ